jgi:hypothetical protein
MVLVALQSPPARHYNLRSVRLRMYKFAFPATCIDDGRLDLLERHWKHCSE